MCLNPYCVAMQKVSYSLLANCEPLSVWAQTLQVLHMWLDICQVHIGEVVILHFEHVLPLAGHCLHG